MGVFVSGALESPGKLNFGGFEKSFVDMAVVTGNPGYEGTVVDTAVDFERIVAEWGHLGRNVADFGHNFVSFDRAVD